MTSKNNIQLSLLQVEHIRCGWQKYLDSLRYDDSDPTWTVLLDVAVICWSSIFDGDFPFHRDRAIDAGLFSDFASPLHFLVRLYMEENGKGEAARVAFEAFDVNPVAFRQYIPQVWWCLCLSLYLYSAYCVHTFRLSFCLKMYWWFQPFSRR